MTISKSPESFAELTFWQLPKLSEIPGNLGFNFGYALEKARIARNLYNSLLYAVLAGSGSAFIAGMAAYSLVFLDLKRPQSWFIGIFIGNLFPFQMFLIPLYLFLSSIGLFDTARDIRCVESGRSHHVGSIFSHIPSDVGSGISIRRNFRRNTDGDHPVDASEALRTWIYDHRGKIASVHRADISGWNYGERYVFGIGVMNK